LIAKVKEKIMANKRFWLGMLVMVLVFGMTVVGCDDGNGNGNGNSNGNGNDVITWTAVTNSTFGSSSIWSIAYGAGKFVAVGDDGKMAYSTDGISWAAVTNSPFDLNNYRIAITYGDGKFVVAGSSLSGSIDKVAYSTDGITWTVGTNTISTSTYDIAYGGGKFVTGRRNMAYSTNGQTWTAASTAFSSYPYFQIHAIAYGNGRFVGGGNSGSGKGKVAYSINGETWTVVEDSIIDTNAVISDIAYGNNKFVAVGGDDQCTIAYSSDGLNWTTTNTTGYFYCIAYGGGKFIATGNKTVYSFDGVTWSTITNSSVNSVRTEAIAYGSGRFVLGSSMGGIWYSNIQE
jgi:hypothetical protein